MQILPTMLRNRMQYSKGQFKMTNITIINEISNRTWFWFLTLNVCGAMFIISWLLLDNWDTYETVFNSECNCFQTVKVIVKKGTQLDGTETGMGLNMDDMKSIVSLNKKDDTKPWEEKSLRLFPGQKIIIYTMFRSGSSFLGDLFANQPGVYYMFEPLQTYPPPITSKDVKELQAKEDHIKQVGGHFLKQLLDCYFYQFKKDVINFHKDGYKQFSTWGRRVFCRYYGDGFFLNSFCNPHRDDKIENRCKSHQTVVIKTIALKNLTVLIPFLKQGVKVIHLVRDPRGQINSVRNLPGGHTKSVAQWTSIMCSQLKRDLLVHKQIAGMPVDIRKNYRLVRYEDLALYPGPTSESLYNFAGMSMHKKVKHWLKESTTTRTDFQWSTMRMSNETAIAWRTSMKFHFARWIQEECSDSMSILGYVNVTTLSELLDMKKSLVKPMPLMTSK